MAAYVVGHMTIRDRDSYMQYREGFFSLMRTTPGLEVVAFDDGAPVVEGALPPGRTVILKFPDQQGALAWYNSDEYQRLAETRRSGVDQHFIIIIMRERPEEDQFT